MSFDSIPEDKELAFECPNCDSGNLKLKGYKWECDSCEFIAPESDGDLDE